MNGPALASYFGKKVPESVETCLRLNAVNSDEIDFVVLHQASEFMLNLLGERLPFGSATEMINELRVGGNTGSSSIPLALGRLMSRRSLLGKKVLLAGFGVGLSWGTTLLQF